MTQVAVSILGADFMRLYESITISEQVADRLHVDVMDGHFVPNLSFGFPILKSLTAHLPIDVHLMISNPEKYAKQYAEYAEVVYVPSETGHEQWKTCAEEIRSIGKQAGIVLNPATRGEDILELLPLLTHVLIMSVEPGFGGQECQTDTFKKISLLKHHKPDLIISVDGGINAQTAPLARAEGADILVSGSFILKAGDPQAAATLLREDASAS